MRPPYTALFPASDKPACHSERQGSNQVEPLGKNFHKAASAHSGNVVVMPLVVNQWHIEEKLPLFQATGKHTYPGIVKYPLLAWYGKQLIE